MPILECLNSGDSERERASTAPIPELTGAFGRLLLTRRFAHRPHRGQECPIRYPVTVAKRVEEKKGDSAGETFCDG